MCNGNLVRHAQLLAAHFAREDVVALTVFHDRCAVDHHRFHPGRMTPHFLRIDNVREPLADEIVDLVGVEDGHIRGHAFLQYAAIEAQFLCRITGQFVHGLLEVKEFLFTGPVTEHPGGRAMPEKAIEVSAYVGSDQAGVGFNHFRQQLGMRVGTTVEMLQAGSPCIVKLNGTKLCFRACDATSVLVRPGEVA